MEPEDVELGWLDGICEECMGYDGGHYRDCSKFVPDQWNWEIETDQNFSFDFDEMIEG